MIIVPEPVQLVLPASPVPRTPGVHLSGIIRSIALSQGILQPEWEEDTTLIDVDSDVWWAHLPAQAKARIAMGLAWESWYIPTQIPEAVDHPGEMFLDGIYMTHDAEELTTLLYDGSRRYSTRLHEVKLTYKSLNTVANTKKEGWRHPHARETDTDAEPTGLLTGQWMWMAQTKGYAYAAGTNDVTLHVLYVCGDYSFPIIPVLFRYHLQFTDAELETNWQLMTEYRDMKLRGYE